jgi:hypothetical protein
MTLSEMASSGGLQLRFGVHCRFCGIERWLGARKRGLMETRNHRATMSHYSAFIPYPPPLNPQLRVVIKECPRR